MNTEGKYDRQILAFGYEGQQRLEAERVGIVGLGGLGAIVAQALHYLGVRKFVLIDDDAVELTNLNRLVGASNADIGKRKVHVVGAQLHTADSQLIAKNLRSREALLALQGCDVIFGCVDSEGPRLILTELSAAYERAYIDCASEILMDGGGTQLADFGGRVVVSKPGEFCLACANELDMEAAKVTLEPEQVREVREQHGYGLGPEQPAPAIVSINGVVANLAVTEYLMLVTGIRAPVRKLTYRGMRGVVLASEDSRRADCYNCGYLLGKRDAADILRYALD